MTSIVTLTFRAWRHRTWLSAKILTAVDCSSIILALAVTVTVMLQLLLCDQEARTVWMEVYWPYSRYMMWMLPQLHPAVPMHPPYQGSSTAWISFKPIVTHTNLLFCSSFPQKSYRTSSNTSNPQHYAVPRMEPPPPGGTELSLPNKRSSAFTAAAGSIGCTAAPPDGWHPK
jgi:hypothetical protein